jgi:hypothetical protein
VLADLFYGEIDLDEAFGIGGGSGHTVTD